MKKIFIYTIIFLPFFTFSQSNFCEKNFGNTYFPLDLKFEKNISWGNSMYKESISDKIEIKGKEYFIYKQDFGNGNSPELKLRKSNDTVFSYYKEKESIFLITRPKIGIKWKDAEIISTSGEFASPYCNYKNLLVVEHKYNNGEKWKRYYKKGLGLVGIKKGKKIIGVCLPNKKETEKLFKRASFKGCENNDNKVALKCTINSINKIVAERLNKGGYKLPKENGILKFKVHISKTGEVDNVTGLNSIKGGKKIKKIIITTLKNLPNFNPTQTSRTKTAGTNFDLSIPIKVN